jgi:hypothetical protein
MSKITTVHPTLADAEAYLMAQGFELAPAGGCDWINAAGDDAGVYPIEREPNGDVEGFRVEINRR